MKELRKSSQFKKDFKRFSKDLAKVEKLFAIVNKLLNGDWLLIWFDKEKDIVKLVRLGSHSELFGKGRKR